MSRLSGIKIPPDDVRGVRAVGGLTNLDGYVIINTGGEIMAFETKLILKLIAQEISKCVTAKEAYRCVRNAANVEGLKLPTFDGMKKELENDEDEDE